MHDPMPRKRHLNEPFHIFFAPVIDQPDRVLVRADDTQRPQFFLPLIRNLELKIAEIQIAYYFFRTLLYISSIRIQFIYIPSLHQQHTNTVHLYPASL